jgi:hypothetical protein
VSSASGEKGISGVKRVESSFTLDSERVRQTVLPVRQPGGQPLNDDETGTVDLRREVPPLAAERFSEE